MTYRSLAIRLSVWAISRGWQLKIEVDHGAESPIVASVGPVTGRGQTSTEALNALADGLVDVGWQDDRRKEPSVA